MQSKSNLFAKFVGLYRKLFCQQVNNEGVFAAPHFLFINLTTPGAGVQTKTYEKSTIAISYGSDTDRLFDLSVFNPYFGCKPSACTDKRDSS